MMAQARWVATVFLLASGLYPALGAGTPEETAGSASAGLKGDFLSQNLDRSVDPGTDFFRYANGGWLARNPIPPSESSWGIGESVEDQVNRQLRQINEAAATAKAAPGSDVARIGDFWAAAMDEAAAETQGLRPLEATLARLDRVDGMSAALDATFELMPIGMGAFFYFSIRQDEKQSDRLRVHFDQGGLGLPNRDFYFNPEPGVAKVRTEYVAHLSRVLQLLGRGRADADAAAKAVMQLETALAKASRKLEDLRDPDSNYHRMTPTQFSSRHTPTIDWGARLGRLGIDPDFVIVGQPEYFSALQAILRETKAEVLRDYMRLLVVNGYSPYLSRAFDDESFRFYGTVLNGIQVQRDRWKRVLAAQDDAQGMLIGRAWVEQFLTPATKTRYAALVEAIRAAYRERIARVEWMSETTRQQARVKLDAMNVKVGWPDTWESYPGLVVGRSSFATNMMNAARWSFADRLSKLGKPVDRAEWHMTPQTYNAYYSPSNNEIVLPAAAFVVPGVADSELDDAVLYGYAGASTIGHEITHGFDDSGRHFDAKGNLTQWWSTEDETRFKSRADVMVRQYDAYEPLPGLHINGKATLGENIADYGGLLLGIDAFRRTEQYKSGVPIAGLTPEQRFFLGYALSWKYQYRDEYLRRLLLSDEHSPAPWRVNGPLANLAAFYAAFGIAPGKPMRRAEGQHVDIW